mgnify:CR=1 FL=1
MLRIGRNLRDLDCPFKDEIEFSFESNFDIIQVWYKCGKIDAMYEEDAISFLKNASIKSIIHAAFDINDFNDYEDDLINKLIELNHKELILHPMIKSKEVNKETTKELEEKVLNLLNKLDKLGIIVYVENNHKHMKCFYTLSQWKNFFKQAPKNTEFLLDIVHVLYADDYEYLKKLVSIKRPKALHIADTIKGKVGKKHLHLPIGKGIIDFDKVFNEIIPDYNDLIILEIKNTDKNILDSREKLKNIL